jgi:NCS2 family nucleobase:cation symporter-2
VRPPDLIYALDERPPIAHLILLGAQHIAVICPYLVFVTRVTQAAGASTDVAAHAVGLGMIAIALATLLQERRLGPIGSGYLAPPVVSAIYFAPALEAAHRGGLPLVCGMVAFAGVFEGIFAWVLPRMRKVFPPVVSGFIVIAVGAELGLIGVSGFLGISDLHDPRLPLHVAVATLTIAVMVGFGVWGKGLPRLLCGLIGLALGMAIAVVTGMVSSENVAVIASRPWVGLPNPDFLSYRFEPSLMVPFAIASLAAGLRAIGVITTCQKINDASWRRPNLDNIRAGVLADGVGCLVGGLLATPGISAAPSLVGIQKITGATSRYIAYAVAVWLVLLSCVPKVGAALLALPLPIIGAALVFNGVDADGRDPDSDVAAGDDAQHVYRWRLAAVRAQPARLSGVLHAAALVDRCVYRLNPVHRGRSLCAAQPDFSDWRAPHRDHGTGAGRRPNSLALRG